MTLNENQIHYIDGLIQERATEEGYDDETAYQSYLEAIELMSNSETTVYEKSDIINSLGGNWADFVKIGDDDWMKNQQVNNAERLEHAEVASVEGMLAAYEISNFNSEVGYIPNDILEEYGNNYFELITYDKALVSKNNSVGMVKLCGVMKEIPSIAMTSTWEAGPAKTISDSVKSFFCSPMSEMMVTLGGRDRSWLSMDEGTDRVYKTVTKPTFEINLKLYTNEDIGSKSMTSWKTWVKALSIFTLPSIDAKVSINAMANNALNGVYGCADLGGQIIDAAKSFFETKDKNGNLNSDKSIIDRITDTVSNVVDQTSDYIQQRDGEQRVTSSTNLKNYYGAKLWYLNILPGIFSRPLIVCIKSWNVVYSKEINPINNNPIWVELKISCEMDQIASVPIWMKYLGN